MLGVCGEQINQTLTELKDLIEMLHVKLHHEEKELQKQEFKT